MSNPDTAKSKELQKEWKVVSLRDAIEELKNGFASGKRDENGIVQIRMNNVTTDGRLMLDSYLKVPVPQNLNNWLLKKDDFLFNNTNSIDLVGKSTIFKDALFPCTFSNHFTRLRFKKELVLPEFILYHFLILWDKGYFKSVAIRHVGQSAVHSDYLQKLQIPLPPLPEQRRIAEVLGTVDSTIQKVGGAIERTERLKRGLMQKLLTEGIRHEEWNIQELGDIFSLEYGKGLTEQQRESGSYPVYGSNGEVGRHSQYLIKAPGIIVGRKGTIGAITWSDKNFWPIDTTYYIKLKNTNTDLQWLFYELSSLNLAKLNMATGTPGLNRNIVYKVKIPLPPLPEQYRIAEILSTVDKKLDLESQRKEKLERIKKGLMNDLLTGEKRVKI